MLLHINVPLAGCMDTAWKELDHVWRELITHEVSMLSARVSLALALTSHHHRLYLMPVQSPVNPLVSLASHHNGISISRQTDFPRL